MTTRPRRVQTFTFSPEGGHTDGNNDAQRATSTNLERKLELLEARFTMPLHFQPQNCQSNNNNSNNNSNSPATLDAENSSPVSIQSSTIHDQSNINRTTDSQQSFAFDTPLLNVSNHPSNERANTDMHVSSPTRVKEFLIEHHTSNISDRSHLPHRWEEIAAQHVARKQHEHQMQICNDSQQHTLQTSHVRDYSTTPIYTTATNTATEDVKFSLASSPKGLGENCSNIQLVGEVINSIQLFI
jgi:hypothetical protein